MTRHGVALAIFILLTIFCYAERPSLPSGFQSKTIHSSEGADIYVRWYWSFRHRSQRYYHFGRYRHHSQRNADQQQDFPGNAADQELHSAQRSGRNGCNDIGREPHAGI